MFKDIKRALIMSLSIGLVTATAVNAFGADSNEDARRAAFAECANTVGMEKPEPGQRPQAPSEEQRAKLDACLKAKGFEPPTHFGGGNGGGRPPGPPPGQSSGIE